MSESIHRDSLLRVSAIVDLLDAGWRPGNGELGTARSVEKWGILPSNDGAPFRIIGFARSLPVRCRIFIEPVFAIDRSEKWARILDEWIVIGDPLAGSPDFDPAEIRDAAMAWLHGKLSCLIT
jgi:hypothetical protein